MQSVIDKNTSVVRSLLNNGELKSFLQFTEDASVVAANNTSGIVGTGDDNQTVVPKRKTTPIKRGIDGTATKR